ncbi:MAG: DUF1559 domain-containing protein [Planctomycetaceae bacterium]|nr:DUF1559 domain-containing protein [Planctomycetaceae bacterium]
MKTFVKVLCCFIVLLAGRLYAQETFAPLVSENCVAFLHVDFSKVEIDAVKNTVQKSGEQLLQSLGFDEVSFKTTTEDLRTELDKLDAIVRPPFETITKELGIRELAVIADMELLESGVPAFIVIPWKNKTEKQLETLVKLLHMEDDADEFVKTKDFLLLPFAPDANPTIAAETVADWANEMKPSPKAAVYEALKSVAGAEVKLAAAVTDKMRLMARSAGLPPGIPNEVNGLLLFAIQKIQWASASLSLNDVLGGKTSKDSNVFLTLKTPRQEDAVFLRTLLEQSIDFGINAMRYAMDQDKNMEFEMPPLFFSFLKGFLRTLLPDVDGDLLKFRLKGEAANLIGGQAAIAASGVGVALLLPAVQAARVAAKRAQCTNNIKLIVLALHNYHDVYQAFPPLYTVDKDGKPLHSWRVLILPFIEQAALYDKIVSGGGLDEPWDSDFNKQFHNAVISVYSCPDNSLCKPGKACTYSSIAGEVFVPAKKEKDRTGVGMARITDGTSNTVAVVEVKEPFCWMDPTADITLDEFVKGINVKNGRSGSFHTGGINIGMFDGSVRFLSDTVIPEILRALGTCAGGENISL